GRQAGLECGPGRVGADAGQIQGVEPLAEAARLRGDDDGAMAICESAFEASARVRDAAYLFPFLVTGCRALLGRGDPGGAERWVERTAAALEERAIPGARPAIDHGRGLVHLATGSTGRAREELKNAAAGWHDRRRAWEGAWAVLDLARCAVRSNQKPDASRLATQARDEAIRLDSGPLRSAAEAVLATTGRRGDGGEAWAPLSAREFEVARLVAAGLTNREIGAELDVAPKTVGAHVEHILAKLGAGRRAEIGAWVTSVGVLHSAPHGGDREE
ncbi:MAG TPA: LuxR C-terminal-related transcriptional regulator, partial [Candidatus Limnocylindrales bacterium]|nr:LuxR C-terminal-related transcriptional regulator [Candidatus Limnocylindrales bacterium]